MGLQANILVHADDLSSFDYSGLRNSPEGIHGERLKCVYMIERGDYTGSKRNVDVSETYSMPISSSKVWLTMGSLLITCPVPPSYIRWTHMRLERNLIELIKHNSSTRPLLQDMGSVQNATPIFTVCNSHLAAQRDAGVSSDHTASGQNQHLQQHDASINGVRIPTISCRMNNNTTGAANHREYLYDLSVCTASDRGGSNYAELFEWIEYHRLMGVQHFFVYDTSLPYSTRPPSQRQQQQQLGLRTALKNYISDGVATVVTWHFENCVKGLASGRGIFWKEPWQGTNDEFLHFSPPKPISQILALSSCYTRFRRTSKYIMHVDDDEFIVLNKTTKVVRNGNDAKASSSIPQLYDTSTTTSSRGDNDASLAYSNNNKIKNGIISKRGKRRQGNDVPIASGRKRFRRPQEGPQLAGTLAENEVESSGSRRRLLRQAFNRATGTDSSSRHLRQQRATFSANSIGGRGRRSKIPNAKKGILISYIEKTFAARPTAPAIRFLPIFMYKCSSPVTDFMHSNDATSLLPRVGKWLYNIPGWSHEGKMVMRTDAVRNFFIHYIADLEPGPWTETTVYEPPVSEAAMLHYKTPPEVSGSIFGFGGFSLNSLPIIRGNESHSCKKLVVSQLQHALIDFDSSSNDSIRRDISRFLVYSVLTPYFSSEFLVRLRNKYKSALRKLASIRE